MNGNREQGTGNRVVPSGAPAVIPSERSESRNRSRPDRGPSVGRIAIPRLRARFACASLGMTLLTSTALAQPQTGTYVIRGGTVVPVVGAQIPNGTVVIAQGKIQAVGANVQAPQGATIIDATGLFVYPGMIDSGTELGLTEIGSVPGSTDTREIGDFNPQDVALTAVNAHSELIP